MSLTQIKNITIVITFALLVMHLAYRALVLNHDNNGKNHIVYRELANIVAWHTLSKQTGFQILHDVFKYFFTMIYPV